MPERKESKEKNCVDDDSDVDSEFGSDDKSPTSSPNKSSRREPRDPTMLASSRGKRKDIKNVDKNDMSNKRNRSKLHLLLYKTKMCVDMNVLFKHAREGETPRSPSKFFLKQEKLSGWIFALLFVINDKIEGDSLFFSYSIFFDLLTKHEFNCIEFRRIVMTLRMPSP